MFSYTVGHVGQTVGRRALFGRRWGLERTRREMRLVQQRGWRDGSVPDEWRRRYRIAADVAVGRTGTSRGGQHTDVRLYLGTHGRRRPYGASAQRPQRFRSGRRAVGVPAVRCARAPGRPSGRGQPVAGVVCQHQVSADEADGLRWRRERGDWRQVHRRRWPGGAGSQPRRSGGRAHLWGTFKCRRAETAISLDWIVGLFNGFDRLSQWFPRFPSFLGKGENYNYIIAVDDIIELKSYKLYISGLGKSADFRFMWPLYDTSITPVVSALPGMGMCLICIFKYLV